MLYTVYLKYKDYPDTLVGAFLMKSDAERFMKSTHYPKDELVLAEVNNVWEHWVAIREELKGKTE